VKSIWGNELAPSAWIFNMFSIMCKWAYHGIASSINPSNIDMGVCAYSINKCILVRKNYFFVFVFEKLLFWWDREKNQIIQLTHLHIWWSDFLINFPQINFWPLRFQTTFAFTPIPFQCLKKVFIVLFLVCIWSP
jgi:hypothetical protein